MKVIKSSNSKKIIMSRKEWENIGKIAGWSDDEFYTESPVSKKIELMTEDMDQPMEVNVSVHFNVEPTEYEGPYVFYRGGVVINEVKTEEPVFIDGKEFPSGTDVNALLPYFAEETSWESYIKDLQESLSEEVNVPEKHYPMTR